MDIKLDNLMIDKKLNSIVIIDFGNALYFKDK